MIESRSIHDTRTASGPTGEPLARFLEARGRRVFEAAGALWGEFRYGFFVNLPEHIVIDPDLRALDRALRAEKVAAVRYPSGRGHGLRTFVSVCRPSGYSLASLDATHRKHVRRGLERCELRTADVDELITDGLAANLDTMARQRRFDPEFGDARKWARFVAATQTCPGVAVTGAFVAGRLSAYLVSCRDGTWLHLLYKASRTADLPHRANAALDFHALREAARDPGIAVACSGHGRYVGVDQVGDAYKRGMGYQEVPQTLTARLHPMLQPWLASRWGAAAVAAAARARPATHRLQVFAALVRGAGGFE